MPDARPGFPKRLLLVLSGLQPVGNPAVLLAAMREFPDFLWHEDECYGVAACSGRPEVIAYIMPPTALVQPTISSRRLRRRWLTAYRT